MTYDPEIHHRRSIRLKGHDYSWAGAYFVTICTQDKRHLFGRVVDGEMRLNEAGEVVQRTWMDLPRRFPTIEVDAFVVMPNHVHGIIVVGAPLAAPCAADGNSLASTEIVADGGAASSAPTLGHIVRAFKSVSAIDANRLLGRTGQPLWQRNYFEHIIRSEEEFYSVRSYIDANPVKWDMDRENPLAELKDRPERWEA